MRKYATTYARYAKHIFAIPVSYPLKCERVVVLHHRIEANVFALGFVPF